MVSVDVPEAFATDPGAKVHVGAGVPPPVTAQVRATAPLKPAAGATVMIEVEDAPRTTLADESAPALTLKSGVAAAVTVSVTDVVWLVDPEVPITEKCEVAIGVAAVVAIVSVDVPDVSEAGLNEQLAPAGKPLQVRATAPLKPLVGETVMVEVPDCPGPTTVAGLPPTEKSGDATKVGHEVTSTLASIEPNPVTRS